MLKQLRGKLSHSSGETLVVIYKDPKRKSENPLRAKSDCFSSFHCIKLDREAAKSKLTMKTFHLVIRKKALIDEGETAWLISET